MWSVCSCVINIARTDAASTPRAFRLFFIALADLPASKSIVSPPQHIAVQLPEEPEKSDINLIFCMINDRTLQSILLGNQVLYHEHIDKVDQQCCQKRYYYRHHPFGFSFAFGGVCHVIVLFLFRH